MQLKYGGILKKSVAAAQRQILHQMPSPRIELLIDGCVGGTRLKWTEYSSANTVDCEMLYGPFGNLTLKATPLLLYLLYFCKTFIFS